MKTYFTGAAAVAVIFSLSFSLASAHMMDAPAADTGAPALTHEQEVAQGLALYQKVQTKQLSCADVKDSDFELMGEYFMGQNMTMADHDTMNDRLVAMMGHDGEETIHKNIGKHGSNCDTVASTETVADTANHMDMGNMDMDHMGANTESGEYSSPLMLLLYLFALIGLISVIKMALAGMQKGSAPITPEVKK